MLIAANRLHEIKGSTEKFLLDLSSKGWRTVVSEVPRSENQCLKPSDLGENNNSTVLVLGNEEKGCRIRVSGACSDVVVIPKPKSEVNVVDSLNVSSAAAILISRIVL